MALNISEKKDVVKEVSEIASSAQAAVAAEYRGLTVQELSELRSNARNLGVYVKVIKNSLAKIAIKDTNFECMDPSLKGPLIFAFSKEDLGSAAKLVNDFISDLNALNLQIHKIDERLSSKLFKGNKSDRIDDLSALEILESYLSQNE